MRCINYISEKKAKRRVGGEATGLLRLNHMDMNFRVLMRRRRPALMRISTRHQNAWGRALTSMLARYRR